MEKSKKREVKRIRQMLSEIVSLAEDEEMEGGLPNAVRRYNATVRHLEGEQVLPAGLFQLLDVGSTSVTFHQVGVESRILSGYLEEVVDEEEDESPQKTDFSPVIALAPFLEQSDLKALIQSHLSGKGFAEPRATRAESDGPPTLEALVSLAPHLSKKDLGDMLEACLARTPGADPNLIVSLAPHMDRQDLGRLLRQHVPGWFNPARQDGMGSQPPSPAAGMAGDPSPHPHRESDVFDR